MGISCSQPEKSGFTTVENTTLKQSAFFYKLSLNNISPKGWVKNYLLLQEKGIGGNLDIAGGYPFNLPTWSDTLAVVDDRAQSNCGHLSRLDIG